MSDLIVIAYDNRDAASEVRERLFALQEEHVITLDDAAVVVRREDGKIKLDQATNTTGAGAVGGALWGGLIGLLFLAPLLGMAIGGAAGAAAGALTDLGVDDDLLRRLGTELTPGGAALILLVREATPDKVLPEIQGYGGTVMQTSLSHEGEARLKEVLEGTRAAG